MKQIIVNLNFDDFHPQSDVYGDFGGELEYGNFKYIRRLCNEFPGLVVTLFTTPNWIDTPFLRHPWWYRMRYIAGVRPVVPLLINEQFRLDKHPEWCAKVRSLVASGCIEIAVHGYYHHNSNQVIHGQEFHNISYDHAMQRLQKAESIFKEVKIPFVKIFRPPGWGVSNDMFKALRDMHYEAVGIDSSHSRTYNVGRYKGLKTIPQNYSIREAPGVVVALAKEQGAVFAKGHMCYTYGRETIENGLTQAYYENMRTALRLLHENYDVRYTSLMDLIRRQ